MHWKQQKCVVVGKRLIFRVPRKCTYEACGALWALQGLCRPRLSKHDDVMRSPKSFDLNSANFLRLLSVQRAYRMQPMSLPLPLRIRPGLPQCV